MHYNFIILYNFLVRIWLLFVVRLMLSIWELRIQSILSFCYLVFSIPLSFFHPFFFVGWNKFRISMHTAHLCNIQPQYAQASTSRASLKLFFLQNFYAISVVSLKLLRLFLAYSLQNWYERWTMRMKKRTKDVDLYIKLNAFIPLFGSSYCSYPHHVLCVWNNNNNQMSNFHSYFPLRCNEQFYFFLFISPSAPDPFSQCSSIINFKWLEWNPESTKSTRTSLKNYTHIENAKNCETATHQSSPCAITHTILECRQTAQHAGKYFI